MARGIEVPRNTSDELVLSIKNGNIDRVKALFQELPSHEARKELANARDRLHSCPVLYTVIRRGMDEVYDVLLDNGADLTALYGPNEAIHVAAMWGNLHAARDMVLNRNVTLKKNLRNAFPSDMVPTYSPNCTAGELQELRGFLREHEPVRERTFNGGSQHFDAGSTPTGKRSVLPHMRNK